MAFFILGHKEKLIKLILLFLFLSLLSKANVFLSKHGRIEMTDTENRLRTRMLRRKAVEEITGFSRASIYRLMKQGKFPHCVRIGENAVAWDEQDIDDWLKARKESTISLTSS